VSDAILDTPSTVGALRSARSYPPRLSIAVLAAIGYTTTVHAVVLALLTTSSCARRDTTSVGSWVLAFNRDTPFSTTKFRGRTKDTPTMAVSSMAARIDTPSQQARAMPATRDTPKMGADLLTVTKDTTCSIAPLLTAMNDTTSDPPRLRTDVLRGSAYAMPPRRKRITKLGQRLRAARNALGIDQKTFAAMVFVSDRTLSRWENGSLPTADQARRIFDACEDLPVEVRDVIAEALGLEMDVEDEALPLPAQALVVTDAPIVAPSEPSALTETQAAVVEEVSAPAHVDALPAAPPRPPVADLRGALDAIVYAAAEERDLLPRHVRAFGVELLQGAERLGLTLAEAAHLLGSRERTKSTARAERGDEDAGGNGAPDVSA
jgi:transcriptional regulator with XRE-family HTH domain